ncbi:MAG: TrmH family RNA methyltransferase [Oceanipulchritudo sp.]
MERLDPCTEEALIAHLLQFVTPEKRARMAGVIGKRTCFLRVVLEDVFQPHNASAVMRSCECFGIQHLHVIENRYAYTLNREVAMGSSNWIHLHRHNRKDADNTADCLRELRKEGYRIVATSLDSSSIPIRDLKLDSPLALWFGTEEEGLSETVLREADAHVHIPMFGFTQSFNISVSAAICLHELRHRLESTGSDPGLTPAEIRAVYRLWLRKSLKNGEILERTFLQSRQQDV